jgi:glycosyltransferase involved in cell wall biosynthesis
VNSINPKFSVLCLTFGQSKFRWAAINSVLEQDYDSWELILIDPSSETFKDLRFQALVGNDRRIICLAEPDSGPAEGLNNGLNIASGELVVCLNGDDLLLKDCFSRILRNASFNVQENFAVIHGNCLLIDEKGIMLRSLFADRVSTLSFASGECSIPHPSTFYRREFLNANNIKFNEKNRTCWDAEIALNILQSGGNFLRINDVLSAFRLHPNSISGSQSMSSLYESDKKRILSIARGFQSYSTIHLRAVALLLILNRKIRFRRFI